MLRSCIHLLSFSTKAQNRTYISFKQCCAVAWRLGFRLLQKKFVESSVAQLQGPLSFSAKAQFRRYFFSKQCCAVAWNKGIHPASEKISKKQCCAVAPTYSAFLLRLKIGHIFFLSTVALLHGDWDLVCYKKVSGKQCCAVARTTQLFC